MSPQIKQRDRAVIQQELQLEAEEQEAMARELQAYDDDDDDDDDFMYEQSMLEIDEDMRRRDILHGRNGIGGSPFETLREYKRAVSELRQVEELSPFEKRLVADMSIIIDSIEHNS